MTLRIFTLVHGEPYLTWMERGLLPSLMWPVNRAALKWAEWHIYTTEESCERALAIANGAGLPIHVHMQKAEWAGQFLAAAFRECIMDAAHAGDAMLVAPPDTIFGEGSIDAILGVANHPKMIVSVAPVRVAHTFMDEFTGRTLYNAQLAGLAFRHLHRTWTEASAHLKFNNSFAGGVSWKSIAPNLYAVTHLLPTPYYIDPHPSDSEWFRMYGAPGAIDHLWPGKLVDEGRQRFIGSSDAAFAAEITMADQNIPVLYPQDPNDPTSYVGNNKHNHVNRNTVVIFRTED